MAAEPNARGDCPRVASSACIHPTATVIGNVVIGERVLIAPGAVLRADEPGPDGAVSPLIIGDEANIQDGVVIHALGGTTVTVEAGSSISHRAIIHGPCRIGPRCFVGFNSVVFNATLGEGVVVLHLALVEGVSVPDGLCVPAGGIVRAAADVARLSPAPPDLIAFAERVRRMNLRLVAAATPRPTQ
ncbi:MAG TPA: carbonate dehydratase [Planctomycetota bacterium]|nr:carbonate dehydratase [Planctomycetota bacterium]HRR80167.1 carbonate dehydratase [Planctomycetota bacterium]HRT97683.1 carbonate dehydratase [Planctomycetota bacterium]